VRRVKEEEGRELGTGLPLVITLLREGKQKKGGKKKGGRKEGYKQHRHHEEKKVPKKKGVKAYASL